MSGDSKMISANPQRRLKICYIAPKTYPIFNPNVGEYFGGANVDLYYLATEMAKDKRFESSFVVADYSQPDGEVIEGVKLFKSLDFSKGAFSGLVRTWRALKRADADVYVMKCASAGVPLVAMFCKVHRRVFVYRLAHLFESDGTYAQENPIVGRLFVWSLRQARLVFAQNATDVENLTRTMGISPRMIPNGHRLPPVQQQTRDTILWVGRDASFKKPERFLELARAVPNEHFTMVCQTLSNDQYYANLITEAGKIPNLQFIRHVPFNQIDAYFQRAKIFVNTSDAEGFPNTFIQACKCGAPILSFNVNPDDFLGRYRCGLCANGDRDSLLRMLHELLVPANAQQCGANGRHYVEENHDIAKTAILYKRIFEQLSQGLSTGDCNDNNQR
jgi:glycosyltransferase involved in cell wall biosynthesis